jgi:hypothetical protein
MFQKKYVLLAAGGALAAGLLAWAFAPKPVAVETAAVVAGATSRASRRTAAPG